MIVLIWDIAFIPALITFFGLFVTLLVNDKNIIFFNSSR